MDVDQPMTFGDDFSLNIEGGGGGVLPDHNLPDDGTHSDNNRSASIQRVRHSEQFNSLELQLITL